MRSYTTLQTQYQTLTQNTSTANATLGAYLLNDSLRYLTTKYFFDEVSYNIPGGTVASQQYYKLPYNIKQIIDAYVLIGGNLRYILTETSSRTAWDKLNFIPYSSDVPQYYYIYNKQLGIFPQPGSSGNQITINYKARLRDLSQADYTTGTVTLPYNTTLTGAVSIGAVSATLSGAWSLATGSYQIVFSDGTVRVATFTNGSTAVTWTTALTAVATSAITVQSSTGGTIVIGSGTTFVADMVGRWLQVTAPSGDNNWYQIESFVSATQLILVNTYQGSYVTGASYTIGEMPILAEDYQDLPVYRACAIYYTTRVPDEARANQFKALYEEGLAKLDAEFGSKSSSVAITPIDTPINNPNLYLRLP